MIPPDSRFCVSCGGAVDQAAMQSALQFQGAQWDASARQPGAWPVQAAPVPMFQVAEPRNPVWAPRPPGVEESAGAVLRPLGLGELFDWALGAYRANFSRFAGAYALVVAPLFLLDIVGIIFKGLPASIAGREPSVPGFLKEFFESGFWTFILAAVSGLAVYFLVCASAKMASDARLGLEVDIRAAYGFAWGRKGALIGTGFLAVLFSALAAVALAFPGIALLVTYSFGMHAALLEGRGGVFALRRSSFLVQSYWWRTFLVVFLCAAFVIVSTVLPGVIMSMVKYFIGDTARMLIEATVSQAAFLLAAPAASIVVTALYYDLRVRKEGLDIELECDSLWR